MSITYLFVEFIVGELGDQGEGGGGATRSGTEKRCSHNLQSGQSAG